jgi:hypothetical protein
MQNEWGKEKGTQQDVQCIRTHHGERVNVHQRRALVAVHRPTKFAWQDWNYEERLTPTRLCLALSNGAVVPVGAHEIDARECTAFAR